LSGYSAHILEIVPLLTSLLHPGGWTGRLTWKLKMEAFTWIKPGYFITVSVANG
jgi:hypothetical protein